MGLAVAESILAFADPPPPAAKARESDLQMSIASAADRDGLSLEPEIRLVRAALLYADHVTLLSPAARLLAATNQLTRLQPGDLGRAMAELAKRTTLMDDPKVRRWLPLVEPLLTALSNPAVQAMLPAEYGRQLPDLLGQMEDARLELEAMAEAMVSEAGGPELRIAEDAGLLTIDALVAEKADQPYLRALSKQLDHEDWHRGKGAKGLVEVLAARVGRLLSESRSLPLLDDEVGALARSGLQEGIFKASGSARHRSAHAELAAGFIERLPTFPLATINEILEVRRELQGPLVRFRREVVSLASEMQDNALTDDFAAHVDNAWLGRVEPALQEIREAVHDNVWLRQLAGELISPQALIRGGAGYGALGVALGEGTATGAIAATASWFIMGAAAATKKSREGTREQARSAFWFLYEAGRKMGSNR